jgi:hypothetical protein
MKTAKLVFTGLLVALLVFVPVIADAHWGFGGGTILGFGLGLFTGLAFAPRPIYVAPPAYYAPPPPVAYPYYVPAPVSPPRATYGYSNTANVSSAVPPPVGQSRCREWKLINRYSENRWDPHTQRWQTVFVERWGWVGAPCHN